MKLVHLLIALWAMVTLTEAAWIAGKKKGSYGNLSKKYPEPTATVWLGDEVGLKHAREVVCKLKVKGVYVYVLPFWIVSTEADYWIPGSGIKAE
jgi:hypothetical protein